VKGTREYKTHTTKILVAAAAITLFD